MLISSHLNDYIDLNSKLYNDIVCGTTCNREVTIKSQELFNSVTESLETLGNYCLRVFLPFYLSFFDLNFCSFVFRYPASE
jgi:hypothetical protein